MSLPAPAADRTALVTGASSGIGVELARAFARRGHGVTLVARSEGKLAELATELAATGIRAEVLAADLADPAARAELPGRVEALGLRVHLLANNAGLSTSGPVARATVDDELRMIEVDVTAVADLCTRFLPGMVERRAGGILNVASTAAFQPLPGQAGYGASKAFVLSYSRALSGELRGTGVSVSVLCPGPVETGFGEAAGFSHEEAHASLPEFMWERPETVAETGVHALESGQVVAIPGLVNRVSANVSHLVPKRLLVPILSKRHPALRRD